MKAHKLLQLIKDNARAGASGDAPAIRLDATADTAHIYVYDVIDQWWGASAVGMVEALAAAGGKPVALHINSPGGDVFESSAMASAIAQYGAPVTAWIDGLCASAATRLALACQTVQMVESGLFMVHESWTMAWGNKAELRATADLLDKVDTTIAADYMRKTGATLDQVVAWMQAETWFTAADAAENGFVDALFAPTQTGSSSQASLASAARWNLSAYANAPKGMEPPLTQSPAAAMAAQLLANRNRLRLVQHRI